MQDKKIRDKKYNDYVKKITPKPDRIGNCVKAFITGGIICTLGQVIMELLKKYGVSQDDASLWTTLILVFISVVLTGFNIYPLITSWGGAGSLVPITGFANSVAAPAIEYKKEGQVFGIGCKIFTISGPVILYGIFSSWVLGLIYWLSLTIGVVHR